MYVALIQTASALPYVLLALPAGAVGDIVDRRKLILTTETWMLSIALILTIVTVAGRITPLLLLLLTFALSAGDAFETPTWRAVLPELVTKEDLPSAAALNGIEFNFARAVGPALAGAVIALWGVGRAFLLNAVSFVGVIVVVARWKRAHRKRTVPVETLSGATIAALRFVRFAPALRAVILRSGVVMFFASGLLALLPSIARTAKNSPFGYGFLLGGFGLGAVLGAVAMQSMRKRWSTEQMLAASTVLFGITTMAAGVLRSLPMLGAVMLAGGAAWIVFLSLYNVAILNLSPDWVRARVAGVWMMVFQGAVAGGSATWGALATRSRHSPRFIVGRRRNTCHGRPGSICRVPESRHRRHPVERLARANRRRRYGDRSGGHWPGSRHGGIRRRPGTSLRLRQDDASIWTDPQTRWRLRMGNLSRLRERKLLSRDLLGAFLGGTPSPACSLDSVGPSTGRARTKLHARRAQGPASYFRGIKAGHFTGRANGLAFAACIGRAGSWLVKRKDISSQAQTKQAHGE